MQTLAKIQENTLIGMNDRYPPHLLEQGLFQLIQNAVVDQNKITKRKGTNPVAASLGTQTILGASAYQPIAGTKYIVALLNGATNTADLYIWAGSGAFTAFGISSFTTDAQMNFVQASNVLYGFNGVDAVSIDSTLTATVNPTTVPQGLVAVWFHNYLFVANVAAFPNRIYWSNLGDPTTFDQTNNFVDINPNDGDSITALAIMNDELYIYKNNTIWTLTGFSGTTFSVTTAGSENTNNKIYGYGTPSQKSVIVTGRDMYYLSFSGGIPHFRSFLQTQFASTLETGIVSYDIEGTLQGLNTSKLSLCAGGFDGKTAFWGVPTGASTYNNAVLRFTPSVKMKGKLMTHRSWVKETGYNPSCFFTSSIAGQNTLYFGDGTTTGNISQMNYATHADNGTAVVMDVRTRDYEMDQVKKAKWKYLYFKYLTGSAGSLNIKARIEQAVNFTTQEILSLQGTSPGLGPTGTFTLGVSTLGGSGIAEHRTTLLQLIGHALGIQFLESTANSAEIENLILLGKPKGYRNN
ncbi:MAG: hypothetical protein PHE73_08785 [Sulfurovaceae bacterium]|nr:hypothetical protein [Sulfurovaceae bacterium]